MAPIIQHVVKNQVAELTALLDGGVSVQATFPAGMVVLEHFEPRPGEWPLAVFAAQHGALACLKLLLERGATIPAEHLASTLASLATKADTEALAKKILETVDVTANAAALSRGLITSFLTSHRGLLEALIHLGADPAARDDEGRTVLAEALGGVARKGTRLAANRLAMIDFLIARGAPVDVADAEGKLPLTWALQMGSHEAALRLMQAGSPAVGRLTNTARIEAAVARARTLKTPKGATPLDLYTIADIQAWDVLLELGEAGMWLDVRTSERLNKGPWQLMSARAPLDAQLESLPLIEDRDSMLRTVAAEAKDAAGLARLKAALALGWDLNLPDRSGAKPPTVLGAALEANAPPEVLESLLAHGATLHAGAGRCPLAFSAVRHASKLQWLADRGVALDECHSPVGTPLHQAARSKASESIFFLVRRGSRLDAVDDDGNTPLTIAHRVGCTSEIITALRPANEAPVDVSSLPVERTARSALSLACARGDLAAVRRAIAEGANADQPDARGSTPLAIAAAHGWGEGIQELLSQGSKPDTATRCGLLPIAIASFRLKAMIKSAGSTASFDETLRSTHLRAQQENMLRTGDVRSLAAAIETGMDVDLPLSERPPLAIATELDLAAVVELLLRAGADPDTTVDGRTCTESSGDPAIVELLVKYGATRPSRPQARPLVPEFEDAKGKVAIFVNAGLTDPDNSDSDEEPPFWVDHDYFENLDVADGNLEAVRAFGYGESFADQAIAAIKALGLEKVTHLFALFESAPKNLTPGPLPDFWKDSTGVYTDDNPAYAGAFAYTKPER